MQDKDKLKEEVREFWNAQACGTQNIDKEKFTLEYFEQIEKERYELQPEIFSFAQFTRFHGKKLLEVGVGAGTDFLQWVRAGADCYGIDLTDEAIAHIQHRLQLYDLKAHVKVGDAENLPFESNTFDIVYSWGVIHHSPNTIKALEEIIRVLKPGGTAKIMVYHRHSLLTLFFWVKHALLKGRPWKSFAWVLWHKMESLGTKAYTVKEMQEILNKYNLKDVKVQPSFSYYDRLGRFNKFMQKTAMILANIIGREKVGWFLTIEFNKK